MFKETIFNFNKAKKVNIEIFFLVKELESANRFLTIQWNTAKSCNYNKNPYFSFTLPKACAKEAHLILPAQL